MKTRLLVLSLLSLLICGVAFGTTGYWTKPTTCQGNRCVRADFPATGGAPTDLQPDGGIIGQNRYADGGVLAVTADLGPQSGMRLEGLKSFTVTVEVGGAPGQVLDAGGTLSATTLAAYYYSISAARWSRAPDLDLTVTAGLPAQSFIGFTVLADMGSIAYVPVATGNPVHVYLTGRK
jgi:hypothetical protein